MGRERIHPKGTGKWCVGGFCKVRRLAMTDTLRGTESACFAGEARKDCYNALGVKRYKIIVTLDLKTSAICQEMDGKIFKQSEYEAGTTAPPFHLPIKGTSKLPYHDSTLS